MTNLNKDIKIFFIDLDGTLLDTRDPNSHRRIPSEANLKGIEEARKAGKHIVISTGRSGYHFNQYEEMLKPKYAVLGNGSQIYKDGKIIKKINISLRNSLLLFEFAKKNKLIFKVDDDLTSYGVRTTFHKMMMKKFKFKPVSHYNVPMHKEYYKIVMWGKLRGKTKRIIKELKEKFEGLSIVSSSEGFSIEITNQEATKGKGNLYVAKEFFGITDTKHMAHIGDTMNDSTVVEEKIRLIAMGNSSNELKKMTKYVGPSYKNGGVSKILKGEYKKVD